MASWAEVDAVQAPAWIASECRELDRLAQLQPGRERSIAFWMLYQSYRRRLGWIYERELLEAYEGTASLFWEGEDDDNTSVGNLDSYDRRHFGVGVGRGRAAR